MAPRPLKNAQPEAPSDDDVELRDADDVFLEDDIGYGPDGWRYDEAMYQDED